MDNLTGQVIKTYELKELIGEGGFGAVYRAHQQFIGREVAIKIILPKHANQPEFIRRFETEAQLVARLEHPHIVPLYDYWREPSGAYLVMRWLRGGSLQDSLETSGTWAPLSISRMLNQIAEALHVAHRQGIIHRDIKPENILLDENNNAYLSDFGIAKELGSKQNITQKNAVIGSPAYLSPEQIKGESITPKSDIYALGLVIYELLTGNKPFEADSPATLMYRHLSEPLPDIILANPELPDTINAVLQRATAKDPDLRYENTIELARDFRRAIKATIEDDLPAGTAVFTGSSGSIVIPDPENPYKGLRAFQQADAADFFGRDVLTMSIIRRLQEPVESNRFLAVVGPSGSGKSSVVKAGVLPELRSGIMPGSDNWFIVEMLPGIDPMEELEAALLRIAVNPPESLLSQLTEDSRGLVRAIKRVLPDDDTELVIMIDQFEELFTLVDEEDVRTHFMDSIIEAVTDPRSRVRVIITLRADFYDRPLNYNRFGQLMRERTEIVLPLSAEELERAITGPARRVGLHLEESLVTAIVADVNEQPGALPLLQYALTELFERRDGLSISTETYSDIGGTMGALARRADELLDGLDDDAQEAARQMFVRLVTLGEGTEDTRRRVLQAELLSIGDDTDTMSMIIDAFGRYRLLTFDHDPGTRTATVEVAHEALIRQWGKLREWLDGSREDLRMQRRITAAADEWHNASKDPSYLARGLRLQQFESWYDTTTLSLNEREQNFLHTSIEERKQREAEEIARQQREEELEARSRNRLRMLVSVMAIASVISVLLAIFAFNARADAERNADQLEVANAELEAANLEAEHQAELALNASQEAQALALVANARNALIQHEPTLAIALSVAAQEAFTPAPVEITRVLASAIYGPGVRYRFEDHTAAVLAVDTSPVDNISASVSADGTLRIWDNATGENLQVITVENSLLTDVDFSPNGEQIVVSGTDDMLHLFDVATGELLQSFSGHTDDITSVAFLPSGTELLSGGLDHVLRRWDVSTGEEIRTYEETIGFIFRLSVSSDGQYAGVAYGDGLIGNGIPDNPRDRSVRLWNLETGEVVHQWQLDSGWVRMVDISPDGRYIASGSWDRNRGGFIRIWDIETGEEVRTLYGHSNLVTGVEFTPDSQQIVSVSWDRSMRVWQISTGIELQRYDVFDDILLDVSVSYDSDYVFIASGNLGGNEIVIEAEQSVAPSAWLIDLRSRDLLKTVSGHQDWIWSMAVHPSGQYAASGSGPLNTSDAVDTTVRLWNLETGDELAVLEGHEATVEGVNFNPTGDRLVSASWDGRIILWEITETADGGLEATELYRLADGGEAAYNAVFSPDGLTIAVGLGDGTIALWDAETGESIRTFGDHTSQVTGLAFSPDGSKIASASWDNTAALWDIETGERLQTFTGHTRFVNDVAFSPDGQYILTGAWDSTARLWDIETGQEVRQFVGHNDRIQTVTFNQAGTLALTGSADTTIRLWDVATGQEIFSFDNHTDWLSQVRFMPDERYAISSAQDRTIRLWLVPSSPSDILSWAADNRYIRDLTCAEREQYRVEPLCDGSF